ncbi:MAG: hypothetical protein E7Z73_06385 [Methanobrevibacter millerae]|uniref:Uncharacterized protein n=1 Tax=Methanobrevibacter millerae TaxID=230361 RepID=A0A8T3VDT6_9EURY|nr:hypothetical protein [Methanobrevibacter millerae]MBE6505352.1 hypothetical protein [Methanobrevibacter millerae]
MIKEIKIFLILLVLFISISTVSAEGNFTSLQKEIDSSTDSIEITQIISTIIQQILNLIQEF